MLPYIAAPWILWAWVFPWDPEPFWHGTGASTAMARRHCAESPGREGASHPF